MGTVQVVLKSSSLWWGEHASMEDYYQSDASNLSVEMSLVRFAIFHTTTSTHFDEPVRPLFVLTMHHSLYDGWCLPEILRQVEAAYAQPWEPLPKWPRFANFIRYINNTSRETHERVWLKRLQGCESASDYPVKAAGVFAEDDVHGNENILPVRAQVEHATTILELLDSVQRQYVDGLPYCTVGFRHIIEQCTDWPKWTRFSSIVQYQNIEEKDYFKFDDQKSTLDYFVPPADSCDIWIMATPTTESIKISLLHCDNTVPKKLARIMLEELCGNMMMLVDSVSGTKVSHTWESQPDHKVLPVLYPQKHKPRLPVIEKLSSLSQALSIGNWFTPTTTLQV